MCGIAGMFGASAPDVVEAMLSTIIHRGPDDGHVVAGEDHVLGARRLSIVDLSGGRQPLSNETGRIWASQNGELYNFPTLRPKLEAKGHRFTTTCDTELLPHLWEDHGADAPKYLDGMFAIAIWDRDARRGLLARDRTGKKPLYYMLLEGVLYYASEIKCLLAVPGYRKEIELEALHHFLSLKHVPAPLTIFKGIKMLPPGHSLQFERGKPLKIAQYDSFDWSTAQEDVSEADAVEEFLFHFKAGIQRRLMGDVPIGFFLSGGVDSSLSTAIAAEAASGKVKTFTLTYGDDSTNAGKELDRKWARYCAEKWGTDHHEEVVQFRDFPETLRKVLRHFDEPFAGVVSTFYLSQLIAKHVKVAVSGDGADELFGSYLSHRVAGPLERYPEYLKTRDARLIEPCGDRTALLEKLSSFPDGMWRTQLFVLLEAEKRRLYSKDIAPRMAGFSTDDYWRGVWQSGTATDPVNKILEAEFRSQLPDQVLCFVDRLSMAHSLEVRTAFLDTAVVRYVARLPGRLKVNGQHTKYLLKQAARRYFPDEMIDRPKEGFLMPVTQWLTRDLEGYVRETLRPERLRAHGFFDPAAVQGLIDALYTPGSDYTHVNRVYGLIVFQEWYELYFRS